MAILAALEERYDIAASKLIELEARIERLSARRAIITAASIDSQIAKALGLERGKRYIIALLGEAEPIR